MLVDIASTLFSIVVIILCLQVLDMVLFVMVDFSVAGWARKKIAAYRSKKD
jgi:hypothetical protein